MWAMYYIGPYIIIALSAKLVNTISIIPKYQMSI